MTILWAIYERLERAIMFPILLACFAWSCIFDRARPPEPYEPPKQCWRCGSPRFATYCAHCGERLKSRCPMPDPAK
jgi:hypothetical protein